ncbi:hypothetical protein ACHRV5_07665 [Flavobacterium sp. FlaQc-52]|uniref:hypothetical protein n=1 Tax=unclassified Flavobacterium TaxID=196869 RepID=UPI00375838A7
MIKKILFICLTLNSMTSFSQDIVSSTPLTLKKNLNIFPSVNNDTKEVTLFLSDKTNVKAIQLNEKMQITDSISTAKPDAKKYDFMIGYNRSSNNTRLFWSSDDYKNIFAQLYDFTSRKITTKEYTLALKNEKVLQKFSENDNFYILTVLKNSNSLKLHIFDKQGNYIEKVIDLEGFHFFKSKYVKSDLYGVLEQNLLPAEAPFSLQNINTENPVSLNDSSKKRKCYFSKNQLVITIDLNVNFTQVIVIDLEKYSAVEKIIKSPPISDISSSGFSIYINSNSFYFDHKIYQTKSSSDILHFTINDLDGNLLQQYTATEDKPIEFKNSEISQEGNEFFGGKKTLETSSQFIRKTTNLNSALACYRLGDTTLITFGGVSAGSQQSGGQSVMNQFGFIGSLIGSFAFNPTMESFNAYSNRKVVKMEGLFDKEGKHVKGDLQPLAFDKIRTFLDKDNDVSSQTLFKTDAYYFGYYDTKTKEYIIRKFVD